MSGVWSTNAGQYPVVSQSLTAPSLEEVEANWVDIATGNIHAFVVHDAATHTYRYVTGGQQYLMQFLAWDEGAEACTLQETEPGGTVHTYQWDRSSKTFLGASGGWKHVNNATEVFAFKGVFQL